MAWWRPGKGCGGPRPTCSWPGRSVGLGSGRAPEFEDAVAGVEAGPRRVASIGWVAVSTVRVRAIAMQSRRRHRGPRSQRTSGGPMIEPGTFGVEPWRVTERSLDLDLLAETESIFALSNGHLGLRGNLDEGEPHAVPGTYLSGFFESSAAAVRGRRLRLSRAGPVAHRRHERKTHPPPRRRRALRHPLRHPLRHKRTLDLRDGVLRREVEWTRRPASACGSGRGVWCRSSSARSPR